MLLCKTAVQALHHCMHVLSLVSHAFSMISMLDFLAV